MKYALWLFASALVFIVLCMAFDDEEPQVQEPRQLQDYKKSRNSPKTFDI